MSLRTSLVLILLAGCFYLYATPLLSGSAFRPEISNSIFSSYLSQTESWQEIEDTDDPQGLTPPFIGPRSLYETVLDAFKPQPATRALFSYRHSSPKLDLKARFNIIAGYEQTLTPEGNYGFLYRGWRINSSLNDRLYLNAGWWSGNFLGNQAAAATSPLIDSWTSAHAGNISLDNATGDLSYRDEHLSLSLGRDRFELGDNLSGSIVLSSNVNDYGYLLAEGRLGAWQVSMLHGSLVADSTYAIYDYPSLNKKNYPDKYIALHQIQYAATEALDLYAGETVIYGNRSIDLNYLLPLAFWRAIEHNQRDRDNVLLFGGATYKFSPHSRIWLMAAIDEFSYSRLLDNWWGNKFALKLGAITQPPCSRIPGERYRLGLELTAVRPWTYTHYLNHNMYSHDQRSLGYPKGSNLVDLTALISLPIIRRLRLDSSLSYTKQGAFGSDWSQNYLDEYAGNQVDGTADWFEGESLDRWSAKSVVKLDLLAHHSFMAGMQLEQDSDAAFWLAWQFKY